ncbi:MAG: class I SAM-dependent methyltransferase [Alphaproteobacteria bacterium]|nr:class I SAM-dependent methyltransferase [Alphaproteobacteria bacterium]
MVRPFARHYDSIYSDKDYESDIAALTKMCGEDLAARHVIEIGAGTGNHTVRLARLVRKLVSIEIDADFAEMAQLKVQDAACTNVDFQTVPLEELPPFDFDGAAAFFNVLNYIAPERRQSLIEALAARLKPGSWFVTDLWNGELVLLDPPRPETREKKCGMTSVRQEITPVLDALAGTVRLSYNIEVEQKGSIERFTEELTMHVWRLSELTSMMKQAGFSDIEFRDRRDFPAAANEGSWHVWMRATRR